MFIPKGLSKKGVRYSQFFFANAERGLSANSLLNTFKANGIKYRRQTFLQDHLKYTIAVKGMEAIQTLPKHMNPKPEYFLPPKDTTIMARYVYTYHEVKTNLETGERSESYRTFATDYLETKQDVMSQMANASIMGEFYKHIVLDEQEIVNCYRGGNF